MTRLLLPILAIALIFSGICWEDVKGLFRVHEQKTPLAVPVRSCEPFIYAPTANATLYALNVPIQSEPDYFEPQSEEYSDSCD